MWQGVYYYLSYAVLFQFLPVGRPVIQRYYSRNAPFPKPKQSSLIRDDKLQGHRSSSGSPDYHWVKINIDWAFDIRVREWKIRSTVHNKAASILLPDDFPQTPAVYARDLHFDLLDLFLLPKKFNWLLLNTGERSARASAYISSKGIPADQFYVNGTSGARRHEPYMDTGAARWQENTPTALTRLCDSSRGPCKHDTPITTAVSLIQPLLTVSSACTYTCPFIIFRFHFVFSDPWKDTEADALKGWPYSSLHKIKRKGPTRPKKDEVFWRKGINHNIQKYECNTNVHLTKSSLLNDNHTKCLK